MDTLPWIDRVVGPLKALAVCYEKQMQRKMFEKKKKKKKYNKMTKNIMPRNCMGLLYFANYKHCRPFYEVKNLTSWFGTGKNTIDLNQHFQKIFV